MLYVASYNNELEQLHIQVLLSCILATFLYKKAARLFHNTQHDFKSTKEGKTFACGLDPWFMASATACFNTKPFEVVV